VEAADTGSMQAPQAFLPWMAVQVNMCAFILKWEMGAWTFAPLFHMHRFVFVCVFACVRSSLLAS